MATAIKIGSTELHFAKAFKAEEGSTLVAEITNDGGGIAGKRVVIIDHPPTAGLIPLIEGLIVAGAEVHLRDHHGDSDRDGVTVARCRELLGDRSVVTTRSENPACASLVKVGEFADAIIIADADQDGVTAALKAAGIISYAQLESDAAILDGPHTGKTEQALSHIGWKLVRAWGAIPAFGAPNRAKVFSDVVHAFVAAAAGDASGMEGLDRLAVEYERKVESAKNLATLATLLSPSIRFLEMPDEAEFDPPTLASELDIGVLVSGRKVKFGPIAKTFGVQISLARTKSGERLGVDLSALAEQVFGVRPKDGWKPENGVISNTPFLLHLSPERWEVLRPILVKALS